MENQGVTNKTVVINPYCKTFIKSECALHHMNDGFFLYRHNLRCKDRVARFREIAASGFCKIGSSIPFWNSIASLVLF